MADESFKCPDGWRMYHSVLHRRYKDPEPSSRFAMFDMDNTLMITPSYYVDALARGVSVPLSKPVIANDFALIAANVREKLLNELKNGRGILVLSNQRGMLDNVPLANLILAPGMLMLFERDMNGGTQIDRSGSFYVGDAAGRRLPYKLSSVMLRNVMAVLKRKDFSKHRYFNVDDKGRRVQVDASAIISNLTVSKMKNRFAHDFSDCDLKFALNNSLAFYTPDEYFYGISRTNSRPAAVRPQAGLRPALGRVRPVLPGGPRGPDGHRRRRVVREDVPGAKLRYQLHARRRGALGTQPQDEFGSRGDFIAALAETLARTRRVVVDSTNHVASQRAELVKLARSHNLPTIYVHLNLSHKLISHLNKLAADESTHEYLQAPRGDGKYRGVRQLGKLRVEPPTLDEGADVVYTITDESFPMEHNQLTAMHLP